MRLSYPFVAAPSPPVVFGKKLGLQPAQQTGITTGATIGKTTGELQLPLT